MIDPLVPVSGLTDDGRDALAEELQLKTDPKTKRS